MSDVECPTCGKDTFETESGMKVHHATVHDESLAQHTYTCQECGEDKTIPEAWAKNGNQKYCSRECKDRANTKSRPDAKQCGAPDCSAEFVPKPWCVEQKFCSYECSIGNRSIDGKTRVEMVCQQCGCDYSVRPDRVNETKTCSPECRVEWYSEQYSGKAHPCWNSVEVSCGWCGSTKVIPPYRDERLDNHFCDAKCHEAWLAVTDEYSGKNSANWIERPTLLCENCGDEYSVKPHRENISKYCTHECFLEHHAGENHACWEGGVAHYGEGFSTREKEQVRERQGRLCASCGMDEEQNGERLSVHHIQKARTFDDDRLRNAKSNLIALCRSCHGEWEQMSPLRPQTPHLDQT